MVPGLIFPLGPAPVQWVGPAGRAGWEHTLIFSLFQFAGRIRQRFAYGDTQVFEIFSIWLDLMVWVVKGDRF